jgi:hypothetical protein
VSGAGWLDILTLILLSEKFLAGNPILKLFHFDELFKPSVDIHGKLVIILTLLLSCRKGFKPNPLFLPDCITQHINQVHISTIWCRHFAMSEKIPSQLGCEVVLGAIRVVLAYLLEVQIDTLLTSTFVLCRLH